MDHISRPFLLACLLAAATSGCSAVSRPADVASITIDGATCSDCPTSLRFSADGTITDQSDPQHPVSYRNPLLRTDLLPAFPLDELHYAATHAATTDGTYLMLTATDSHGRSERAAITYGGQTVDPHTSRLSRWTDMTFRLSAALPRTRDIDSSLRAGTLRYVQLDMLGCYGSCAAYRARFNANGTASLHLIRACPGSARDATASIPFHRAIASASELAHLRDTYEIRTIDTLHARVIIATQRQVYVSDGPDSTTWGRNFSSLVARWDQLVRDTAWNPAVSFDCPLRKRQ